MAIWVTIGFGAPLLHAIAYVTLSENRALQMWTSDPVERHAFCGCAIRPAPCDCAWQISISGVAADPWETA